MIPQEFAPAGNTILRRSLQCEASEKSIAGRTICALVVDAVLDHFPGQKVCPLIQKHHKPCIVIVNKIDLVKPPTGVREFLDALLDPDPQESFLSVTPHGPGLRPKLAKISIGYLAVLKRSKSTPPVRLARFIEPGCSRSHGRGSPPLRGQ